MQENEKKRRQVMIVYARTHRHIHIVIEDEHNEAYQTPPLTFIYLT